jgi:hypothetical protein
MQGCDLGLEPDGQTVLVFLDQRRAVEVKRGGVAGKVRGGHQQVERVARGQERGVGRAAGHGVERLGQQAREADPAERRGEPARADQPRDLAPHFAAQCRAQLAGQIMPAGLESGPAQRRPDQRLGPELGKAAPGAGIGIEQDVAVGAFEPEMGERFEALSGGQRLGEEDRVDAPALAPERMSIITRSDSPRSCAMVSNRARQTASVPDGSVVSGAALREWAWWALLARRRCQSSLVTPCM